MFAYTVFFCFLAAIYRLGSASDTVTVGLNFSCDVNETACPFGCCPYPNAVCCIDGCCPSGNTCIPWPISMCLFLEEKNDKMALASAKSTPVKSYLIRCPPGTTTCGADKCCKFRNATCCLDGEHCCPQGYICDVRDRVCRKESENDVINRWSSRVGPSEISSRMSDKSAYKSCPGNRRTCPSYMSCCIDNNGDWGCCPDPSLQEITYGGGECCDTWLGHVCCPDISPWCTWDGCF